jgi:2-methylcitrate dehydratase PrpD
MSHVLDYDDTNLESFVHPSAPVWPAICALSSMATVSGKEALLAFVLGYETENRIGRVIFKHHDERGWHMSGMVGGFGAAAAVGKIMALNGSQMQQAFGIAATYASGLREMFGTMSKSLHPGKAAMSGLYAALLVQAGFTSSENVLETPRGFFAVNAGEYNLDAVLDGIGKNYGILKNSVKPYSCGVVIHPTVDGIISLRNREKIHPHEVSKIEAEVHPMVPDVTGKKTPKTGIDGKFSIYHCMAASLVDGACGPDQFSDERVHAAEIVSIRELTSIRVNPDFRHEEARVIIYLKNGKIFEAHVPHASGTPQNPVTDRQLFDKYVSMAGKVIGADNARTLADKIWKLEEIDEFNQIIALTTPTTV